MSDPITALLDPTRLLFDLQRGNEIAQRFSGYLEPEAIAHEVTEGLVEKFDCAFARLWLLEPDQTMLKLVASSGMYTHTNGSFARVPMGAYKVGKIAQNRVSFLSNNLAEEPWVGNREWAIANNIRGFAGYPLAIRNQVIGVLAAFSHHAMAPEFLEVLQTLCTMVTVALDAASQHDQAKQHWQSKAYSHPDFSHLALSDQLANILRSTRLTLVGTEQPLTLPLAYVFLKAATVLQGLGCAYCRLIYTVESIALEAIVSAPTTAQEQSSWVRSALGELFFTVSCLGGVLQTQAAANQAAVQVFIKIPYPQCMLGPRLHIRCRFPVLQMAFTHLAFLAGLTVCDDVDAEMPVLTDDLTYISLSKRMMWVQQGKQPPPKGVQATVDLSTTPAQLQEAVATVTRGKTWGISAMTDTPPLSDRELEMMSLLAQGLRDRDIANQLIISESTVKFHINNILAKLKARTRYQALHQVIVNGWIES